VRNLHNELAAIVTAHVPDSMEKDALRELLAALTAWIDTQVAFALADNSLRYMEECARKLAEQREAIADAIAARAPFAVNSAGEQWERDTILWTARIARDFGKETT
jgi:hypothetical protein